MLLKPSASPNKPQTLRRLLAQGTVVLPGAFNAPVAMLAQQLGFPAVYISGAGLINGLAGYPDIGLLGMDEMARQAGYIANAVEVPAICDADTGYGEALQVMRTVQFYEQAGLSGLHLEDQQAPKRCGHLEGKSLISPAEMERKMAAAAQARRNPDFLLIARTDSRAVEGLEASIERGLRYLEAGADALFPEALQTPEEFGRYAEAVKAPLLANMTEFGKSPYLNVAEFAALGYRMVIFPMTAFRAMMKAVEQTFRQLRDTGTQAHFLDQLQTRQELYELLQYSKYTQLDTALAARFPE
ncbi:MAG: methylisocitrate lyase [Candidatus Handelsmanbacteria bacterium]|nr:methylisocitrate lyase [Candidatus Handelsmanbacteria bacterium]